MGVCACLVDDEVGLPGSDGLEGLLEGIPVGGEVFLYLFEGSTNAALILQHLPVAAIDGEVEEIGKAFSKLSGAIPAVLVAIEDEDSLLWELLGNQC